jgi:hypothetical protein
VSSVVSVRLRGGSAVDEAAEARHASIARHAAEHDRLHAGNGRGDGAEATADAGANGQAPEELAEV